MTLQIRTDDHLVYQFFPVNGNSVIFKIRAPNDAHIALTSTPYASHPMYEIFLGARGNTKSVIRKDEKAPDLVELHTPNLLNPSTYRGFWIRWEFGTLTVGVEGNFEPLMKLEDPCMFTIEYFGICTGFGANGDWMIERSHIPIPGEPSPIQVQNDTAAPVGWNPAAMSYPPGGFAPYGVPHSEPKWVPSSEGNVPMNSLCAGHDVDGSPVYVARAYHEGALLPAKLVPAHRCAYAPWGGREFSKSHYEVLVDCNAKWVPSHHGEVPPNAFPAGRTENGEQLYVGKTFYEGGTAIGKVQGTHGVLYIPFAGKEVSLQMYEVLCT